MTDEQDSPLLARFHELLDEDPSLLAFDEDKLKRIQELSAQGFVQVLRRIRQDDGLLQILHRATPEQLTSLFDLDVWTHERIDSFKAREWLACIAESYAEHVDRSGALVDLIYAMDPEMWTFALIAGTAIIELDPAHDDAKDQALDQFEALGLQTLATPDGFYVVGTPPDEHGRHTLSILERVYAEDINAGRKLLASIHYAVPSQIEEDLLRFRSGRLSDLGFVEWEEAVRLFTPLAWEAALEGVPDDVEWVHDDVLAPETSLTPPDGSSLLARVISRLDPHEQGVRTRQFMLLVNEVMAAERFEPGDQALQHRALTQAQSTISLGLEMLAKTQPSHPDLLEFLADRVRNIGLRNVFRVGYGALHKLRKAALALHKQGRVSLHQVGSLLDRPWGTALASLVRWYPELPIPETSSGLRPLASLQDVAVATRLIAQANALAQLTFSPSGYGVDPVWLTRTDEPEAITLGDLIRTEIIMQENAAAFSPLSAVDVKWAQEHLLANGKLLPKVYEGFHQRLEHLGMSEHYQALSEVVLMRLKVELTQLDFDDSGMPDLKRLGGFLTLAQVSLWLGLTHGEVN